MADAKKKSKKSSVIAQAEAKANKIVNDREKAKKAGSGKSGAKKPNGVAKYFKDLKSEIKKVTWPSWKKVVNNTAVVLVGMCASGIVVWAIDSALTAMLKLAAG